MALKPKHVILVSKDKLTTRSFSPSSLEQFEVMHLLTCDMAIRSWRDHWVMCPVCAQPFRFDFDDELGLVPIYQHRNREEISS